MTKREMESALVHFFVTIVGVLVALDLYTWLESLRFYGPDATYLLYSIVVLLMLMVAAMMWVLNRPGDE